MKRVAVTWLALCLAVAPAAAQQAPATSSPRATAADVLMAHDGGDSDAVRRLASDLRPDPWALVEQLLLQERADVAAAYADQVARRSRPQLVAYVERRRVEPVSEAVRDLLALMRHTAAEERASLDLSALDDASPSVTVANLHSAVAHGHQVNGRHEEALAAYRRRVEVSATIGWVEGGSRAENSCARLEWSRGRQDAAIAAVEAAVAIAGQGGLYEQVGSNWTWLAGSLTEVGRHADAAGPYQAAVDAFRELGNPLYVAHGQLGLGECLYHIGRARAAVEALDESLALTRRLGVRDLERRVLNARGGAHFKAGRWAEARADYEGSRELSVELGSRGGQANALSNLANIDMEEGRVRDAMGRFEEAIVHFEQLGQRRNLGITLARLGVAQGRVGNLAQARETFARSFEVLPIEADRASGGNRLVVLAEIETKAGRYAEAISLLTRACDVLAQAQSYFQQISALHALGTTEILFGRLDRVREIAEEIRGLEERVDGDLGRLRALHLLLMVERGTGSHSAVLEVATEGAELARNAPDVQWFPIFVTAAALAHFELGHSDEAITALEESLSFEARHNPDLPSILVGTRSRLARCHFRNGDIERAQEVWRAAQECVDANTDPRSRSAVLGGLALCELRLGNLAEAQELVRAALALTASMGAGLSEEDAAYFQSSDLSAPAIATEVAFETGDPEFAAWVFERTAANALRQSMGSRSALENAVVPRELLERGNAAREAEQLAARDLGAARASGNLKATRAARRALEEAQEQRQELARRIQREAASAAELVDPRHRSLAEMQAALGPTEALVHYQFSVEQGGALVIRPHGARLVAIGTDAEVTELLSSALLDEEPHLADDALTRMRALLVDPLGLGEDVTRVFVVPRGRLAYVPFGALLPERDVAFVPSGTTMALLDTLEGAGGTGVLAVGDPVYGRGLTALPGTRSEVEAVGTRRLLGEDATEAKLLSALREQERWRAIHFACHGLVDAEHPSLSSLALTPDETDDGFLSCLDLYGVKTPTDLVVLSACQTARGRVYGGEGVLGLTRAFMHGGSPRIICSLWNVDDAATSALMKKFYELWNPQQGGERLPTATALRRAQAYVRSQEPWSHPRYWAAWVLWGLAD